MRAILLPPAAIGSQAWRLDVERYGRRMYYIGGIVLGLVLVVVLVMAGGKVMRRKR